MCKSMNNEIVGKACKSMNNDEIVGKTCKSMNNEIVHGRGSGATLI